MEPLTLWEKFVALLWTPFVWTQCTASHPLPGGECYCQRRRFHFGPHRDWQERTF